ncbi:hypothetical protein LCGC14_0887310 [marine sediment metagenome]|uniref:Uncharacterized protein n=1 Tax=marine sediment metagenome TaxID=412755 RepID=A0A0F9P076_9ZZZZ
MEDIVFRAKRCSGFESHTTIDFKEKRMFGEGCRGPEDSVILHRKFIGKERTLLCHFRALSELLDEVNPITKEEFAQQFPRTYNAVVKDDPYSFELPES